MQSNVNYTCPPLYIVDIDFYATLLQLGLEPVDMAHAETQTEVDKNDKTTQTEKPGILWGYF